MTHKPIRFKPAFDASTWSLFAFIFGVCVWPVFISPDWLTVSVVVICILICVLPFFSIRYEIDGDELIIYQFFRPTRFPIMKIGKVEPVKTILSAPATSLTQRIAIYFTDRKVLKSSMPIIISPADRERFIQTLLSVNPEIQVRSQA